MRIGPRYDSVLERVGALFNLVPVPVGLAMFGMPVARSLQVAQRLGLLEELATGPRTAAELAAQRGLREQGTQRLLDVLTAAGQLELNSAQRYQLASRAAKWLDPKSKSYVGDFLADTAHYWGWWADLESLVRDGRSIELHDKAPDDPYWRSYITGQYQLARLSSNSVAKAVALPADARSLLDVAGAHGEFSMALCRRHHGLSATVVDLPGSARIGRELVAAAGMSHRVRHLEGDMFEAALGGPHDGALVFNIVHHLSADQATRLFRRIAAALKPARRCACLTSTTVPRTSDRTAAAFSACSSTSPQVLTPTKRRRSPSGWAPPALATSRPGRCHGCRVWRCSEPREQASRARR